MEVIKALFWATRLHWLYISSILLGWFPSIINSETWFLLIKSYSKSSFSITQLFPSVFCTGTGYSWKVSVGNMVLCEVPNIEDEVPQNADWLVTDTLHILQTCWRNQCHKNTTSPGTFSSHLKDPLCGVCTSEALKPWQTNSSHPEVRSRLSFWNSLHQWPERQRKTFKGQFTSSLSRERT